ncbi:FG-GAP-like repeat-containing protein [Hymenobacter sp. HDW8]|uniref:FG-GAP-like repeat-containing protein n=1 Tax=Hymenobacter sp. HDW8 TaxID=2714932 RepID=UPI00140C542A|nr:FG-GAP-like repeat-containing protein [Hymenobacter sp. HDW8]QIL78316.1 hypothetical protein G7064_21085 [Hymenobacter sp. HDW8]
MDGDGDLDLLTGGSSEDGAVSVRLNTGQGIFDTGYDQRVAPSLSHPAAVALADVDGDGDLDLLASQFNGRDISIRLNRLGPDITRFSPASGRAGTLVTVTGTRLEGTTAVLLDGNPVASFTQGSGTSLTFVVPEGATSGLISLTTPMGTVSSDLPFTILGNPPPLQASRRVVGW